MIIMNFLIILKISVISFMAANIFNGLKMSAQNICVQKTFLSVFYIIESVVCRQVYDSQSVVWTCFIEKQN